MYKIILADDEGLVLSSLRYIIEGRYGDQCELFMVKSGRDLLRVAEQENADVAFVDIYMPGINGLQAISAMQQSAQSCKIIVLSAYDQFDFAQEALSLGAELYLTKPFTADDILTALAKVLRQVDLERTQRDQELDIWEKLERVEPLLEASLIYSMLFREPKNDSTRAIKDFLNYHEDYGQILLIEWGDESLDDGRLTNPRGAGVKVERLHERLAALLDKISKQFDISCRAAFGALRSVDKIAESLELAEKALKIADSPISHADDLPIVCAYQEDYPIDLEDELFEAIEAGDANLATQMGGRFFDWMQNSYPEDEANIRLKTLEFVLFAERMAYLSGGMTYRFSSRGDYLDCVTKQADYGQLREWFLGKIEEACRHIAGRQEQQLDGLAAEMKAYIDSHYQEGISLEDLSLALNVSSYYCSKLFKDKTGQGFVEYVTECRIDEAKRLLADRNIPIKDVCARVGYSDPNYFSRIFKKACGLTPSEFREERL